tara:strand:- start:6360 stop:7994 length:1635 start_codon:yes stop_codon:yes gene_type:complete
MGWSKGFIKALKKPVITPSYRLVFHNISGGPGGQFEIRGGADPSLLLANPKDVYISADGPEINGCAVGVGDWGVSFGSFSVPVVGQLYGLFPDMIRGSFASLFCMIDGIEERIAFGMLKSVNGVMPNWVLEFDDFVSSLQSSANPSYSNSEVTSSTNPISYGKLFNTVGATGNVTAYTLGGNTINITNPQYFLKQNGENGLIRIEMKDSSGTVLGTAFAEWTSKTSTGGGNEDFTLSADSKAGNIVYPGTEPLQSWHTATATACAIIKGFPGDLLSYFILSIDGDGTDIYDKFPESWCVGGNFPSDLFDRNDMALSAQYIVSSNLSTDYEWSVPIEDPFDAGLRTFTDLCANLGQWPIWRQNSVTYRGARKLIGNNYTYTTITTDNIIRINSQELYSSDTPTIYAGIHIKYGASSLSQFATGRAASLAPSFPFQPLKRIVAEQTYDPTTNASHMAAGDVSRIQRWYDNLVETVDITVGLEYAGLVCGDLVEVTCEYLLNNSRVGTKPHYDRTKAMVISTSYSINNGEVNLVLATYRDIWSYVTT